MNVAPDSSPAWSGVISTHGNDPGACVPGGTYTVTVISPPLRPAGSRAQAYIVPPPRSDHDPSSGYSLRSGHTSGGSSPVHLNPSPGTSEAGLAPAAYSAVAPRAGAPS